MADQGKTGMSDHQHDIDLLLSLQDRVLETPPASPSISGADIPVASFTESEIPKKTRDVDASIFFDAAQDFIEEASPPAVIAPVKKFTNSNEVEVEKFSGLRIRNKLSNSEISRHLADIKFVHLSAIERSSMGDSITGCWATVGVLAEIGDPRTSSTGKKYYIYKFTCLDEEIISVFLFGDAHKALCKERAGGVFALFNCSIRKNSMGSGFSLSVYSDGQLLKIGTSVDYGVCKGKRKDGMPCTVVINKRKGIHCKYHDRKTFSKYSSTRTELMGGNLKMARRGTLNQEGIYTFDPLTNKANPSKVTKPAKFISVEGLKNALSKAEERRLTTNSHSQGLRFLAECAGRNDLKCNKSVEKSRKRVFPFQKPDVEKKAGDLNGPKKFIELEYVSSDDEP